MTQNYFFNDWWVDAVNLIGDDLDFEFDHLTRTQKATFDGVTVLCVDHASESGGFATVRRTWTLTHPRWSVEVKLKYARRGEVGFLAESYEASLKGQHFEAAPWFKWLDGADYVAAMRNSGFSDEEWMAAKLGWPAGEYHIE